MAGSLLPCLLLSVLAITQIAAGDKPLMSTDKLMASVMKKDYDMFTADLHDENAKADESGMNLDMNQPDSKGRLLLVEAARNRDSRFADALLQYGAYANVAEYATGITPLHAAVQIGAVEVFRLLLAYGGNPDAEDKTNRSARQLVGRTAGIRELLEQFDQEGPAAFEDAPGAWIRSRNEGGEEFWHNLKTGEARWNIPPQCAWQRMEVRGHPAKYVNSVTGQETTRTPKALAWRFVHLTDHADVWHNWALNETQVETPAELPEYIKNELMEQKNVRWYNEKTGEMTWEDPKYHTHWRELADDDGKPFYYNIETTESTYEVPEQLAWTKMEHEQQPGNHYYFNTRTGESTWELPAHMSWTKHDSDL